MKLSYLNKPKQALFGFGSGGSPAAEPTPTPETVPETDPDPEDKTTKEEPKTGLDAIQQLLDNKPDGDKKTDEPTPVFDPIAVLGDEEAVGKIMEGMDFTKSFSEETLQLLQDQDPKAFMAAINDATKASYLQAMRHTTALSKQHLTDTLERFKEETRASIQASLGNHDLAKELPEINNPIIKLGIENFVTTLKAQNPTMPAAEVASTVRTYLKELNATFNPDTGKEDKKAAEPDWFSEFGL